MATDVDENQPFVMKLAKVVIAAAWADGELHGEEVNSLKDLLFTLVDVTADDWVQLEIYMDSPVSAEERERLLNDLLASIHTEHDKRLVLATCSALIECDGKVTDEEREVMEEIRTAVETHKTGLIRGISRVVGRAISRRMRAVETAHNREARIEDFIKNKIYFQVAEALNNRGLRIDLPESESRKLCLAAGLMARVAWVDEEVSDPEKEAIRDALRSTWGLTRDVATMVAEVSASRVIRGLDGHRLNRSFHECTSRAERRALLRALFQVANACNKTSPEEIEEIRVIAKGLKMSHAEFVAAKRTIPAEDRGGL